MPAWSAPSAATAARPVCASPCRQIAFAACLISALLVCAALVWVRQPLEHQHASELVAQVWERQETAHQCTVATSPANRVCTFENLLLYQAQLWYIYQGDEAPELPNILVNWHHNIPLQLRVLSVSEASHIMAADMEVPKVTVIPQAAVVHRQWHLNYYHSMTESLFEVFNLACAYLGHCHLGHRSLTPIFIDQPGGPAPWAGVKGDWTTVLPSAAEALECFFPTPAIWIGAPDIRDEVFLIKSAVAGVGLYNRKWPGALDIAARFHAAYSPVNTTVAHLYRQGLLSCLGITHRVHKPRQAYNVTILNRSYPSGRHIVNTEAIAAQVSAMDGISDCRIVYTEQLSLRDQAKLMSESDIVIMNHGAAMGNIMFMPPGSVILMYNWVRTDAVPHTWVTALIEDLALPVNFIGLSTQDRRFLSPIKENYIFQREYARLSAEAKLDLLETGICPIAANLQDCNDMKMNYAIDWNLLKPALTQAVDIAFINTWRNRIVEA